MAFDIFLNGIAGYVLSRVKPKGSVVLETLIFWYMMLPGISMVPLYMSFADVPILHVNLLGGYLPLWMMAGTNAFNIFLFRNFFNGISMSYIELTTGTTVLKNNELMLLLMLAAIPPIIVYIIFSRQINGGVDMSGIKG